MCGCAFFLPTWKTYMKIMHDTSPPHPLTVVYDGNTYKMCDENKIYALRKLLFCLENLLFQFSLVYGP